MDYLNFTETQRFVKRAGKQLGEEVISDLQIYLCSNPDDGAIIPNSGGVRKMRWAGSDKGKRGGARIIYYFADKAGRILLLDVYVKNEKENLSTDDIKDFKEAVKFWLEQLENLGEI